MAANPITSPGAFDHITLDRMVPPGRMSRRKSGGDRSYKVDQLIQPLNAGAYTVLRYAELSQIEYVFSTWYDPARSVEESAAEYAALQAWLESLNKGNEKRPPKSYKFLDLYLVHNKIREVIPQVVGALEQDAPGKMSWSAVVRFQENKRPKPFGGAVRGPKTDVERELERVDDENKGLQKQVDSALAAAKLGGG